MENTHKSGLESKIGAVVGAAIGVGVPYFGVYEPALIPSIAAGAFGVFMGGTIGATSTNMGHDPVESAIGGAIFGSIIAAFSTLPYVFTIGTSQGIAIGVGAIGGAVGGLVGGLFGKSIGKCLDNIKEPARVAKTFLACGVLSCASFLGGNYVEERYHSVQRAQILSDSIILTTKGEIKILWTQDGEVYLPVNDKNQDDYATRYSKRFQEQIHHQKPSN